LKFHDLQLLFQGARITFRGSPLARIIGNSLGPNGLAMVVVNLSPDEANTNETIASLRFAASCS
jgi:hypothetical protein